MVLYEYDGNAIMAEPIKNIKASELLRSFQVMEQKLTSRGLKPKLMTLDKEASTLIKDYLHDQDMNFKLAPPHWHQRNAAERAIHSFEDHLIAGVCSTDKSFPMHLWDRLLPQAILTLDMLRTSRINPKISAAHLNGQYEYSSYMVRGIQLEESDVCKPRLSCESIAAQVAVESGITKIIPVVT
jgi:hypothetical protein